MSMQMRDNFKYYGKQAEVIAISSRFTFTPSNNLGIDTASWGTANYRGFWCDYVIDGRFIVNNIFLFSKSHDYPVINGRLATEVPEYSKVLKCLIKSNKKELKYIDAFPMQYKDINYQYEYSGKIVIGIEPQMHMSGKERYKEVYELCFDAGILIETTDISEQWKTVRDRMEDSDGEYWWEKEESDYSYLLNYEFMGVNDNPSG